MDTQNLRTMCLRELMNDVGGKIFCSICVAVTLEPELTWHVCSLSNVAWMIVMTSGSNTWACYSSNRHYGVVLLWHLNTLIWRSPVFWWNLLPALLQISTFHLWPPTSPWTKTFSKRSTLWFQISVFFRRCHCRVMLFFGEVGIYVLFLLWVQCRGIFYFYVEEEG
jgi:hypothetical protein